MQTYIHIQYFREMGKNKKTQRKPMQTQENMHRNSKQTVVLIISALLYVRCHFHLYFYFLFGINKAICLS